ncbi:MAG: NADH:ubiquinone oxidoreductase subunit J [Chloroflexi bacterium]|nr:NADH:ubiquinone oxidoreductase subunit J [Chloroflexota bacterium]|tara:strand:+ start:415 stop:1065 length:651 start_codon:yes stop_codon:yes gene_type:complete
MEGFDLFERLPVPAQFDRLIVTGGIVTGVILGPVFLVLLSLLLVGRISAPELVFWLGFTVIVVGALGTVLLQNIVHAAFALIAALIGVAAMYLLLASEFLALVQVLVYGGGVVLLIIFALMMTNAQDDPIVTDGSQKPFAFIVTLLFGGVLVAAAIDVQWGAESVSLITFRDFGARLFRDFMVPVIIVGVLLDIALSGAIVNARPDIEEHSEEASQ